MPRVQKIMGFAEAPRSRRRSLAQRGEVGVVSIPLVGPCSLRLGAKYSRISTAANLDFAHFAVG
jgi:hypothetical protein